MCKREPPPPEAVRLTTVRTYGASILENSTGALKRDRDIPSSLLRRHATPFAVGTALFREAF